MMTQMKNVLSFRIPYHVLQSLCKCMGRSLKVPFENIPLQVMGKMFLKLHYFFQICVISAPESFDRLRADSEPYSRRTSSPIATTTPSTPPVERRSRTTRSLTSHQEPLGGARSPTEGHQERAPDIDATVDATKSTMPERSKYTTCIVFQFDLESPGPNTICNMSVIPLPSMYCFFVLFYYDSVYFGGEYTFH